MIYVTVNKKVYDVVIVADEISGYTIFAPERKECITEGETIDEAIRNLIELIKCVDIQDDETDKYCC